MSTATTSPQAPQPANDPDATESPEPAKPAKTAGRRRTSDHIDPAAVNLLSPWVMDELRVNHLRRRFGLGVVTLVLLVGLAWVGLNLQLHRAETEVRGEEALTPSLSAKIADLSDVRTYVTSVDQRSATVTAVTAAETQFSRALSALDAALPRSASLDTLSVALPTGTDESGGANTAACPGPDPFGATEVIACLELSGTAADRGDVSTFVQRLARVNLFVEPFVATTTNGTERGVTFTGSVGITYAALSDPAAVRAAADAEAQAGADSGAEPGAEPSTEGGS